MGASVPENDCYRQVKSVITLKLRPFALNFQAKLDKKHIASHIKEVGETINDLNGVTTTHL